MEIIKNTRGFIALISTLIISALLTVAAITLSTSAFYARVGILDFEEAQQAQNTALACIEVAALRLGEDNAYSLSETDPLTFGASVSLGQANCTIVSITHSGADALITVEATVSGLLARVQATISLSDLQTQKIVQVQ